MAFSFQFFRQGIAIWKINALKFFSPQNRFKNCIYLVILAIPITLILNLVELIIFSIFFLTILLLITKTDMIRQHQFFLMIIAIVELIGLLLSIKPIYIIQRTTVDSKIIYFERNFSNMLYNYYILILLVPICAIFAIDVLNAR